MTDNEFSDDIAQRIAVASGKSLLEVKNILQEVSSSVGTLKRHMPMVLSICEQQQGRAGTFTAGDKGDECVIIADGEAAVSLQLLASLAQASPEFARRLANLAGLVEALASESPAPETLKLFADTFDRVDDACNAISTKLTALSV